MPTKRPALPPASPEWAYFLDIDGTLIELAERPDAVVVPDLLHCMVSEAHRRCHGAFAVVSGRALSAIDHLLMLPDLPAAGQHGLERRDAHGHLHHLDLAPSLVQAVQDLLAPVQARHRGLLIEAKGATLAIHYRLTPRLGSYLHRRIAALVDTQWPDLQIQKGKYVLELKPRGYDKGSAVHEFMLRPPFHGRRPVFIGDDLTDEHGFSVVNAMQGLSIKVGRGRTRAHYRLPDVSAVHAWLLGMGGGAPCRKESA